MENYYLASGYGDGQQADMVLFICDSAGRMEVVSTYTQGDSPSFLCTSGERIYAVSECLEYAAVTSYVIQNGKLVSENRIRFEGAGLCHLYAGEKVLYASCYGSGQVYVLDEKLANILYRYEGGKDTHMHWTAIPDGKHLMAADCGTDRLLIFPLKNEAPEGEVREILLEEGSGPRQILYDRKTDYTIIINEHNGTIFFTKGRMWDNTWTVEGVTGFMGSRPATKRRNGENYPGGACISLSSELFVANRGADTVAVFDLKEGGAYRGEWNCGGSWPRHLHITEENILFAACERSNQVNGFFWKGGQLSLTGSIPLTRAACTEGIKLF